MEKNICRKLFLTFLKIGAFTFGGGYAMIPLIKREMVEEKKWLKEDEIFDIIAIAESTPGPLAVNAATFAGTRIAGFKGALAATSGVVLPSFLVILFISNLLMQIEHLQVVQYAFLGIRAAVVVLIGSAVISLYKQMKKDIYTYIILIIALILILAFQVNSILTLLTGAVLGLLWEYYLERKFKK